MRAKLFLTLALLFVLVTCLVGCGEYRYEVIYSEGGDVIRIENARDDQGGGCTVGEIRFESYLDMKSRLTQGRLSKDEIVTIVRHFPKNADGDYSVHDLEYIYLPIMPNGLSFRDEVRWYGQHYLLSVSSMGTIYGDFCSLTKARYEDFLQIELDHSGGWNITTEYDEERDAEVVTYVTDAGKFRQIRYTISAEDMSVEDTTLYVIEQYTLSRSQGSLIDENDVSETVPTEVSIFGKRNEAYFCYYLDGLPKAPERSWLSCFSTGIFEEE